MHIALEGLNERQRVAVVLNKFEDMNYAEIAEIMGLIDKRGQVAALPGSRQPALALKDYIYMDGEPKNLTGKED